MRAAGNACDGGDRPVRQNHGIVGRGLQVVDDLLDHHDGALRGEHDFLLAARDAFEQHIALAVGAQRVDDSNVWPQRRHGRKFLARIRTRDRLDARIDLRQVDADVATKHRERQVGRACVIGVGHAGVGMFLNGERVRPAILDGVADAMRRADSRIAAPREHKFFGAAHADHLIVDQIRRHADQRQATTLLANDLVACRERDQMCEALHGEGIAIVDVLGDRIMQRQELSHRRLGSSDRS